VKKKEDFLDGDDDLADDIFVEAFQKKDDDYKEEPQDEDMDDFVVLDDDEDEENTKPKKRGATARTPAKTPAKAPAKASAKTPTKPISGKTPRKAASTVSRKRKPVPSDSEDVEDGFEEEEEEALPKKKTPAKKPPAKKARAPAKAKEVADNSDVKKILDAIPTIRAPTPPPREQGKKFNFKEFAGRQAAAPAAPGSKELPTGAENCLAGLTFVFTGILDSISREEGQQLVKRYGGKVTTAPSRKTSYVVLGRDAGPSKLETIRNLKLKTIDEDGLFQIISSLPANGGDGAAAKDWGAKKAAEEKKIREAAAEMQKAAEADAKAAKAKGAVSQDEGQLWTTKYAPSKMTDICGNKGQVEKLQKWLRGWSKNLKLKFRVRGADGAGGYRAAMIHGPPGIGKTTAAHLVAKLEGFDVLEYNASDTRSKKLMEETMRGVLDNTSLMGYFGVGEKKQDVTKKKLVLIMDEVDGMSAGDRGGVGSLAAFCRKTSVSCISYQ